MGDHRNDSDQEHVRAVLRRRDALIAGAALVAAPFLGRVTSIVQAAQGANTVLRVGSPAHARWPDARPTPPDRSMRLH